MPCRTFPQEAPVSVKGKILMLVVLGSRLAISCGLDHQSSSGSLTAFTCFLSKLSSGGVEAFSSGGVEAFSSGGVEALGWVCVFRGQRNSKVQGAQDAGGDGRGGGVGGKYIFISS